MYVNSRQNSVKQRSEHFGILRFSAYSFDCYRGWVGVFLLIVMRLLAYFFIWWHTWRLGVFLPFAWCISIYWDGLLGGMAGVVGLGWRICCPGILDNVYVSWDCVVVVLHDNLRMCSLRYVFYSQAISYYVLWMKKCAGIKKCAYSTASVTD